MCRFLAIGGLRVGTLLGVALLGACASRPEPVDPLVAILAREKASALAAGRIGKNGGTLKIEKGDAQDVVFTIPKGALSADTIVSLYAAKTLTAGSGFRAVGPAVEVRGEGGELVQDAVIEMPFLADAVTGPLSNVVVLFRDPGTLGPLAGSFVDADKGVVRAPTRDFGSFVPAVDTQYVTAIGENGLPLRCPQQAGWGSLRSAINGTTIMARASMSDAEVYHALATQANGCGFAFNWEVVWYSPGSGRTESYSYAATGTTGPEVVGSLTCTAAPFLGTGDSDTMSADFAVRYGTTPQVLRIEVHNCDTTAAPLVRFTAGAAWADYDPNGNFLSKNF